MSPIISPVHCASAPPSATTVVIIGAGIVGLSAALALAERNVPVVVLEKGRVAGEQSSRNLGWIRKTSRHFDDLPLAMAADRLWAQMPRRVGYDVGYRQAGIMFVARDAAQMAMHERWLESVRPLSLGSRLLKPSEINQLVPGGRESWAGGILTQSDGRAEPTLAVTAIANAAIARGVVIVENCAVRSVTTAGGRIDGVVTEHGEVRCGQVLLAGGLWSRRLLGNLGVTLPTLPLNCSVLRTAPMEGPTEIAVGGPDFSFRKHIDGGFVITQRGALDAPLTLDHALLVKSYLQQFRAQRNLLRVSFGKPFFKDLALARRWSDSSVSPFERIRTQDPAANPALNSEALANLGAAWPAFAHARIEQAWAGTIDVTPDSLAVIGPVQQLPGMILASGFSGHGFGTSPAAGQLAADLLDNSPTIVDPAPYRIERFT